ncbi:hypothetical protein [Tenacibaculum sp.]|uniref:hypothetical protein n=1 Tax=Tenacibaculum sp. TaxID=1906242 RepID=UPI003AA7B84B
MSYLNQVPDAVPVHLLTEGDKFARTSYGAPRPEILNLVCICDEVCEAETSDGRIKTFNKRTLVHKL